VRLVLGYGYRVDEVNVPALTAPKASLRLTKTLKSDDQFRPPVLVGMGPVWLGQCMPHPDPSHAPSLKDSIKRRAGREVPLADPVWLEEIRLFTRSWCKGNLTPLAPDSDVSKERWLDNTSYPDWRKKSLLKTWEEGQGVPRKYHRRCKGFPKDECYEGYNYLRIISAREDMSKVDLGAIFKLIEEKVFQHPMFIKKVPVADRPAFIKERLMKPGRVPFCTDFTAFESSFVHAVMEAIEWELYSYMVQHLPTGADWLKNVKDVLGGVNEIVFKHFKAYMQAVRQSGEMNTSLGNGFANAMVMLFLCAKNGTSVDMVVEGDDGLASIEGEPPTPEQYARLGFIVKLEKPISFARASFCGNVFDEEDLVVVTNPLKVLATAGWTQARYAEAKPSRKMCLLRSKALSMAYQYPQCPIIWKFAQYLLRETKSFEGAWDILREKSVSQWEKERLSEMLKAPPCFKEPGQRTRQLVADMYGISPQDQIKIEQYFDDLVGLAPIDPPVPFELKKPVWTDYWDRYVVMYEHEDNYRYPAWLNETKTKVGFSR